MMPEPLSLRDPLVSLDHPSSAFDGLLAEGSAIAEVHAADICLSRLWPEEERLVAGSVEKRRREFTAGRHCARLALQQLGVAPAAIGVGSFREPLFPAGVSGSITHTREYCAAAVIRTGHVLSIGIDAELNQSLDRSVADLVLIPNELRMISTFNCGCHPDTLVFSIKEAFFKAIFPFLRQYLEFSDAIVTLSPVDRTFLVSLREADMTARLGFAKLIGRYRFDTRHLYTAVTVLSPTSST
jgi:4'-phosphopantetheinyl transferase EntD